jgi:hypothetical protein
MSSCRYQAYRGRRIFARNATIRQRFHAPPKGICHE